MRWLMALAIGLLGLTACHVRRVHHHDHPEWVVVAGHRHDDHCGHYHRNGRWYYWEGHHHGPNCGHARRDGVWIVID